MKKMNILFLLCAISVLSLQARASDFYSVQCSRDRTTLTIEATGRNADDKPIYTAILNDDGEESTYSDVFNDRDEYSFVSTVQVNSEDGLRPQLKFSVHRKGCHWSEGGILNAIACAIDGVADLFKDDSGVGSWVDANGRVRLLRFSDSCKLRR